MNWKDIKEDFEVVYKDKLRVVKYRDPHYPNGIRFMGKHPSKLRVFVQHPCESKLETELLVFDDGINNVRNPWIHYSPKVEEDLLEVIRQKLEEQVKVEEDSKDSGLDKEMVQKILEQY